VKKTEQIEHKETILAMQTTDIEQEIRSFLVENFLGGRADGLRESDSLLGSVIDSAGVLELVMFLQDRFGITVGDDEVNTENLDSVKNAVRFVERKLAEKA
jgi:acyl carrier protein